MLGPQGTLFFLLLMVAFGGLLLWLALTKQIVFRVLAACLAFIPAMVFGIAAVNKYYDYYQTWGALFSDLSGQAQSMSRSCRRPAWGPVRAAPSRPAGRVDQPDAGRPARLPLPDDDHRPG